MTMSAPTAIAHTLSSLPHVSRSFVGKSCPTIYVWWSFELANALAQTMKGALVLFANLPTMP